MSNCEFPDDLYYDVENDVWLRNSEGEDSARVGITTVLIFVAGKFERISLRTSKSIVSRGDIIATLESPKYFGAVRSPVLGSIKGFNFDVQENPRIVLDSPYENGWLVEYDRFDKSKLAGLYYGEAARAKLESRIKELRIRCFKTLWDDEMYAIGIECSATLVNLDDLLSEHKSGYVVHLVTDDPTADIEMVRWSMQTGNELLESRTEDNLYHFIVRKK